MSTKYHKINSIFKRDEKTKKIIEGDYSIPEFEYLANNIWRFEEKIDGTNIRIIPEHDKFLIRGRTDNASIPTTLIEKINSIFTLEKINKAFNIEDHECDNCTTYPNICLYGEGCGVKIQKNGGKYTNHNGVDFILFDVKINNWWLKRNDVIDIANKLNIRHSIQIGEGTINDAIKIVKEGLYSKYDNKFLAEGIVARSKIDLFARNGDKIITKIKTKDFYIGDK